jgi:Predicted pyridoxal phosphate-dependent enzyme apparently involved in regulation of cell wall biogenesis
MGMCFRFIKPAGDRQVRAPAITWPGTYCMAYHTEFYDVEPFAGVRDLLVLVDLFGAQDIPAEIARTSAYLAGKYPRATVLDAAHNVLDRRHGEMVKSGGLDAVVYSFGAVKQLSGIRGGMVVSPHVDDKWRAYRHYGVIQNRVPELPEGGNFDMNDFSAALILEQLKEWEETRAAALGLLSRYVERLSPLLGTEMVIDGSGHLCAIWHVARDRIRDALRFEGIETSVHYKLPAWLNPFDYPRSREWANTVLTLPLHSRMGIADVDRVCEVVVEQIGGAGETDSRAANRQASGAASPES